MSVIEAENVPKSDLFSEPDPYVVYALFAPAPWCQIWRQVACCISWASRVLSLPQTWSLQPLLATMPRCNIRLSHERDTVRSPQKKFQQLPARLCWALLAVLLIPPRAHQPCMAAWKC